MVRCCSESWQAGLVSTERQPSEGADLTAAAGLLEREQRMLLMLDAGA
jgi:hypothetical protein